jgi:hypothetical protein
MKDPDQGDILNAATGCAGISNATKAMHDLVKIIVEGAEELSPKEAETSVFQDVDVFPVAISILKVSGGLFGRKEDNARVRRILLSRRPEMRLHRSRMQP